MTTNYMSGRIVQKFYLQKLNTLFNQSLKYFQQIHGKETVFDRRIIRGRYYIRPALLWNITQTLMVISFRRFWTSHRSHLQYPNNQEDQTSRSLFNEYIETIKPYTACCNKELYT